MLTKGSGACGQDIVSYLLISLFKSHEDQLAVSHSILYSLIHGIGGIRRQYGQTDQGDKYAITFCLGILLQSVEGNVGPSGEASWHASFAFPYNDVSENKQMSVPSAI